MGSDKALLRVNGETMIERAIRVARVVATKTVIVGPRERYSSFGETIEDVYPDSGPLSGLHAALASTQTDLNLVLSVDTPNITPEFLSWLASLAEQSKEMAVIPQTDDGVQPLCGVYRRALLPLVEQALKERDYKVDHLFSQVPTRYISEKEIEAAGFSAKQFFNVNTPEDYSKLMETVPVIVVEEKPAHIPEEKNHTDETRQEQKPYIEFVHVSKAFGSNVVLRDVNFEVRFGETVCILGRSGVGKSVSLHQIMGFLKPDSGRVWVAYEDITDYSEEELERIRKKVTMVFQNGALFDSLTVGENVAFPLRERGGLDEQQIYQIVDGLLEMVGVREYRDKLPSDLSTGLKRSVAIARALAAQPEAVLYDEPTTMVDPLMAHLLGDLIKKLKKQLKLTSIVVTHDMALAKKLADRLLFLHEGRAIFFGTYAEMTKSPEPIVQEFLALDSMDFESYFGAQRPEHQPRV